MSIPFLKDSKGTIVNVSATAGNKPEVGGLVFSVSKSMVNMLTKCTALELAGFGIRVNAVAPSFVDTPARTTAGEACMNMSSEDYKEFKRRTEDTIPLDIMYQDKILKPEEVADAILWLASSDASYVTGEILTIDGGQELTTNLYNFHVEDMVSLIL
jgi:NAD(P)-dependent dehydrogenase (short-subunit alcohol dehydrogenase family)